MQDVLDARLSIRTLIQAAADRLGARDMIRDLPDVEAVRSIQQREGYTPCYGREVALQPGPDGICLVSDCCWRNFCDAYRSTAAPLDKYLTELDSAGCPGQV